MRVIISIDQPVSGFLGVTKSTIHYIHESYSNQCETAYNLTEVTCTAIDAYRYILVMRSGEIALLGLNYV
jgi:hypothetical protein